MILFCLWYMTYIWCDDKWKDVFLLLKYGIKFKAKSGTIFMLQMDQVYHYTLANWGGEQFAMVFSQKTFVLNHLKTWMQNNAKYKSFNLTYFWLWWVWLLLGMECIHGEVHFMEKRRNTFQHSLHFVAMPTLSMFVNGWLITLWIL